MCIIKRKYKLPHSPQCIYRGIYDNNEAEYASLLYGMNILEELGIKYEAVTLRGDSRGTAAISRRNVMMNI